MFNYRSAAHALGSGTWLIQVKDEIDDQYWVKNYLGSPYRASKDIFHPLPIHSTVLTDNFNTRWQLVFHNRVRNPDTALPNNWIRKPQITDGQVIFDAKIANAKEVVPIINFSNTNWFKGQIISKHGRDRISFSLLKWPSNFLQRTYRLQLIHKRTNHVIPYRFTSEPRSQIKKVNREKQVLITYHNKTIRLGYQYRQLVMESCNLIRGRELRIKARLMPYQPHEWCFNHLKIEIISQSYRYRYLLTSRKHQIRIDHHQLIFIIPLLSRNGKQLRILKGKYHLIVYLPVSHDRIIKTGVVMPAELVMKHARPLAMKTKDKVTYRVLRSKNGRFKLRIKQPWTGLDHSKNFRSLAYSVLYPLMRLLPLRKVAVFDCYWATQFSSNERSIYEYLQKHYPKIKTVWFFRNRQTPIKGDGERVRVYSLKYWYYLATAKYLFQNGNFPDWYFKRNGQIETETLHGTFLKHIGYNEPYFKNGGYWRQKLYARRNRRWDYLVVPSEYMKRTAARAFDYHQKFILSGFPRNDELAHYKTNDIERIKKKLNIPLNKKVILYAPTYRSSYRSRRGFHFPINLKRMKHQLAPNYVLLVRLHYFIAHYGSFHDYPGFVYDVSDYPDINDLYLISDVLVTDYSSVMFDYAYLKRPIIYYAYDKQQYLNDHNRGTYLDYDHDMPGPIVTTENALIKELKNLSSVKSQYHDQIVQFANRFAEYGRQGDATKQVVETVLHTKRHQLDQKPDRHVIFNKFWRWFRIQDFQSALLAYLGRHLPKKKIMIFDSFFGNKYSDNPKAIYLYMKHHEPQYQLYWNVSKDALPYFKAHHIPYVVRRGYRGIVKQARARYWVTNARRPFSWKAPQGATVLQTWHGTPLKTIGADVKLVTIPGNNAIKYHQQVYQDDRRWNYLLAPNLYSAQIMQRAFRKSANQMMLTGYPRDDILVNATSQTVHRIKQRLGITSGEKVILYAPTWRDNVFIKNDEYVAHLHLDLDKIRKHYGHKIIVLIRTHYMISNYLDLSKYRDIAINVSNYQDIADLYLISDVLITDYSSVMFDYAVLKRPMIFFDYDYRHYANRIHGFYFNFRKVAPGPIVTTTDQLIQKLDRILAGHWLMSDNYQRFVKKFTPWMDGHASERVVHQLLHGKNMYERFLSRTHLHLPAKVKVRDGAAMWRKDKDFTKRYGGQFMKNYDYDGRTFKVIKGMQLHSASFNTPLGIKYVLLENAGHDAWVSYHDIIGLRN